MSVHAACIDVTGSKRSMDVAYIEDGEFRLTSVPRADQFCDWIVSVRPKIIGIDAPSKRNPGLVPRVGEELGVPCGKYGNYRVSEALLRMKGIGLYNTPQSRPPSWMERGWDIYGSLIDSGYDLLDTPGQTSIANAAATVMEVHPHASFVVGLGWIPQPKQELPGQVERMAYLRSECADLGLCAGGTPLATDPLQTLSNIQVSWDDILKGGIALPSMSHDQLDAMVGVTTVLRAERGEAWAVGHDEDGVIVLPKKPADHVYRRLQRNQ